MRTIEGSDGVTLAVHEHGGLGRPTLLCHATGFHGAVWEPLSGELGDGFECWAPDLRGHGASVGPPGHPLDWAGVARDVLSVVEALPVEPGRLLGVGHSMGAAALLLAEQARPGTFAGLWLFEPVAPPTGASQPGASQPGAAQPGAAGNHLAERALRRKPSFPTFADALINFAGKPPLQVARADALLAYVRHGFVEGEDGAVHLACRPEDESRLYAGGGAHGAYERLSTVTCPTLVVCGGEPDGPSTFAPAVAAALPAGRLEVHPHLGHFGPLEAPTELAASVRAFASAC